VKHTKSKVINIIYLEITQERGINMLFIQSFIIYLKNTKNRLHELVELNQTNSREFIRLNLSLIQANRIIDYIVNGSWAGEKTRETFMFWVNSDYDSNRTMQKYKISADILDDLIKKSDKLLEKKLDLPIRTMISGKIFEGMTMFYENISKVDKVTKNKKVG